VILAARQSVLSAAMPRALAAHLQHIASGLRLPTIADGM
jgi:hypothetical protein